MCVKKTHYLSSSPKGKDRDSMKEKKNFEIDYFDE
jgi:hypothetical protein